MNLIILIVAVFCEVGFTYCLVKFSFWKLLDKPLNLHV